MTPDHGGRLRLALAAVWLLDAALQYQPFMFGNQFVPSYITANAQGQPEPLSWLITTAGTFISPNVGVWNALFATIQLFIGVGLLFPRLVRPALITSFFWVLGIWVFGEGIGGVLTGTASALSGAPGSVLMYGLLALMAWPRATVRATAAKAGGENAGVASSASAQGIGGVVTPLTVWAGFWFLSALLFLLPANRVATSVSGAISGMADGQPPWYAHFLTHVGNWFGSAGVTQTWILALISIVIGLGPLLFRRVEGFLLAGFVVSIVFWLTAQGVGGVLTGSGTDPNTGPLVAVLALAMVPRIVPNRDHWTAPALAFCRRHTSLTAAGAVAGVCALLLAATYPAAAATGGSSNMSSNSTMPGMNMSSMAGMTPATQTTKTANCTPGSNGSSGGLDLTNSPIMAMGSQSGATMNMNGADASAAAGFNATTPNWSYTGPALPTAEANELLTEGVNGNSDIHMATSGCAQEPTFGQEIRAFSYVRATSEAAGRYQTPESAQAAGYELVSPADYPVTYYVNPTVAAANEAAGHALDSSSIDGLVYAQIPSGREVLAAAMYILPSSVSSPPLPYGALVQWHKRMNVCVPEAASGQSSFQIAGVTPCAAGTVQQPTPYVTMVWQLPVAGGPLAIQPPDIQIVESAVTATTSP
jgi:hypothetical protein